MTVNEAIEELTKLRDEGYGNLSIYSEVMKNNEVDVVYDLNGFHYKTSGITSDIIMELDEEYIY